MVSTQDIESESKTYGKVKSYNAKVELSKTFLDSIYIQLLKSLDALDPNSEEYQRTWVKVFILSHMVQNDFDWFTVRDFQEILKLPIDGEEGNKWRVYIGMFLYRLYKKGFLNRRAIFVGSLSYEYQVKMEKVMNPEIFLYESYEDLVREGLV